MRTYAEYLNTMTVKSLNALAKAMHLKGYSKLRKAELVAFIDDAVALDHDSAFVLVNDFNEQSVKIEKNVVCMYCGERFATVAESVDHINACNGTVKLADIVAEVAVTFSAPPVKAPQINAEPRNVATLTKVTNPYSGEDTDDLIAAYRNMRATQHNARGITHAKLEARLAKIENVLRSRKVNMREV